MATKIDEVFEALYKAWLGKPYEPGASQRMTASQRGRLNRAASELRAINATPDEVRVKWALALERWPGMVTPQTVVANWATLEAAPRASTADEWLKRQRANRAGRR